MLNIVKRGRAAALSAIFGLAWFSPQAFAQILPPLPTGSLIVTVTSPASGSTFGGTVPVSASVSIVGSLTVAGVQFKLDGNNLGAEDTSSPYSVSWNTTTASNGSHTLTAVARDQLGILWTSNPVTVTVFNDNIPPTVSITFPASGATVPGTITVSANASDNVGVAGVQFRLDGANNLGAEDTAAPYSVSWNTTTASNGSHTLTAVARDAAGNRTTSAPVTVTVLNDTTPPTVTINQAATQADPTKASPINFTVVFSEPVSGFTGADVAIGGTAGGIKTVTVTGGPSTYNAAVSGMTNGTVIATIAAGVAQDAAGNTNIASTSTDNTVTFDATAPTMTINQAAGQADPTNVSPINFTVVFSEPVSGFTGADVTIGGTAGGIKTVTVTGGPSTYNAAVSGVTTAGTVIATIAAGVAQDAAGNTNTASTSTDNTVTFNAAPSITGFTPASGPVGTIVTISGTGFVGVTAVTFNAVSAGFIVDSATSMRAEVPAGATTGLIRVTTPGGTATSSTSFTVTGPTIASFTPASGPAGTVVTISGTGFVGVTAVTFNAVSAGFIVDSATSMRAEVPAGATSGPIRVTTPNGTATSTSAFDVTGAVSAADATPPTVSITSPAAGAALFGTLTVTAKASDDVGVVGVQFQLDGANLGAEDTVAPYSVFWNTTAVADGSHVLTAVARDAAGHVTTSAPVTVTVANAAPPPATVTRFEETDRSVAFAGSWVQGNASRPWSGTTAALSTTAGDPATFTFTGTSVSWIGARTFFGGIARVSLDGAFVTEVDTYSTNEELGVPVFTATGLANASHTLTIEVTGRMNAASTSTLVVVDAFDVPAATISRLQETDPAVTYTAGWAQGGTGLWSGGTAAGSATAGDQATFTFTGTSVSWIGGRGPQTGIARVFLDGVLVADNVDTFAPAEQRQAVIFTSSPLADASHTLMIEVTGLKNAASTGAAIVVDAFDVTSSGTRFQETSAPYTPGWGLGNRDKAYSEGSAAVSKTQGDQATFSFTGTSISWIGARGPQAGIARVFLDGSFVTDVDMYAATEGPQDAVFTSSPLAAGSHTLTIEVTGQKNPASADASIVVDAFDVTR